MIRALLLFLLCALPAAAQQVPNPQPRNTVASNAELILAATTAYPLGVWRMTFSPTAGRPAPPQFYWPSEVACSLNGGDGDSGGQVKSSDNKCWIAVFGAEGADVRQWGMVFDGATDSTISWTNAVAFAAANGGTLRLPSGAGRALVNGAVATIPNGKTLQIIGAGADSSVIQVNGGYGLDLTYGGRNASVNLRDFSLCDATQNTGKTAIRLSTSGIANPAAVTINELSGLTIRGCAGFAQTQGFTTGVNLNQVSNVNFNRVMIHGPFVAGFPLAGTSGVVITGDPVNYSIGYNFIGVNLSYHDTAITAGAYTQGVTIAGSNFVINNHGVSVPSATGTSQLAINGSAFECITDCISGAPSIANIYGNLLIMDVAAGIGMHFAAMNAGFVLNNHIVQYGAVAGLVGVKVDAAAGGGGSSVIRGNDFIGLATGINLAGAGDHNIRITDNAYSVTNPIVFGAGAKILEVTDTYVPFANVVPCAVTGLGARVMVIDSIPATWGTVITGGGLNPVAAVCNGTNLTVYAK